MRVLLFSAAAKADGGGVQRMVIELADHLRSKGHSVIVAWPDGDDGREEWRLQLTTTVGADGRPTASGLLRGAMDVAWLARRLTAFRPNVINLHYPQAPTVYFMVLKRLLRFPVVLSFHNSDLRQASPAVLSRLPAWLMSADLVTAVSADLSEELVETAPTAKVETVANGIDTAWWTPDPGQERDPSLVVAAGRLIAMKGFDCLLDGFAAGAPADARLIIAGEGEDRKALEAQAVGLGLEGRVEFPGRLPPTQLRELFRGAGLYVMPSRREGMPLALLEAMACGLPAVATSVNAIPHVLAPNCGALVPPEDVHALAAALRLRIGNADRLAAEGREAHAVAQQFDSNRTYERYEAILSSTAVPRRGTRLFSGGAASSAPP